MFLVSAISVSNHAANHFGRVWYLLSFWFDFIGFILLFEAIAWGWILPCWSTSGKPCCYWQWHSCIFWLWNDGGYSSPFPCGAHSNGNSCLVDDLLRAKFFSWCVSFVLLLEKNFSIWMLCFICVKNLKCILDYLKPFFVTYPNVILLLSKLSCQWVFHPSVNKKGRFFSPWRWWQLFQCISFDSWDFVFVDEFVFLSACALC